MQIYEAGGASRSRQYAYDVRGRLTAQQTQYHATANSIVTRAEPVLVVKSIQWNRRPEGYAVYNFVVDDDHTYFVGNTNGGIWVHNIDCTDIIIDREKYPEAAAHIEAAQAEVHPTQLTIDRAGASARRKTSLKGYATSNVWDGDEYPPAVASEGGAGASVRHIPFSDNRGAGASMGGSFNIFQMDQ